MKAVQHLPIEYYVRVVIANIQEITPVKMMNTEDRQIPTAYVYHAYDHYQCQLLTSKI